MVQVHFGHSSPLWNNICHLWWFVMFLWIICVRLGGVFTYPYRMHSACQSQPKTQILGLCPSASLRFGQWKVCAWKKDKEKGKIMPSLPSHACTTFVRTLSVCTNYFIASASLSGLLLLGPFKNIVIFGKLALRQITSFSTAASFATNKMRVFA